MNIQLSAMDLLQSYLQSKNEADLLKFRQVYTEIIPSWHVSMLNDVPRNNFYRTEIQSKVKNKIVMDLGCGSGLLTYFALEAGAKHIYAIEKDPILQTCFAHAFRKEIQEGRVSLFKDLSLAMVKEDFMHGKPEVVIHEIFSNDLFSERVMEAFNDLFQRELISPNLEFIPQKFKLFGKLHIAQENSDAVILDDSRIREKFWFLETIISSGEELRYLPFGNKLGNDISEVFEIFSIDLKHFSRQLKNQQKIEALSNGNYIRTWFELIGDHSILTTDIRSASGTHWENPLYRANFQKGPLTLTTTYQDKTFSVVAQEEMASSHDKAN